MANSEHITGLTVAGFYYLFTDNEMGASACWKAAMFMLPLNSLIRASSQVLKVS